MSRNNFTFITEYDIRINSGYPEIEHDTATPLKYGSDGETDYVLSFYKDILNLRAGRKTAFVMSYSSGIAPHEKISYLKNEIFNETADFVINSPSPDYNTGLALSPVKYFVVQSLTGRFLEHMHRTTQDSDSRQYTQTDFVINLHTAARSCFDTDGYFIPTDEALHAVSPFLNKDNFYTACSSLEKASEFGAFDMSAANNMFKAHTLNAVRDISRIFREYILETGEHVYFRQETVNAVIRNEAAIITEHSPEKHIKRAVRNNYILNAHDLISDGQYDGNHPRTDYINIRKQSYYDEYLFAYYRSLDGRAVRDDYTERLKNGKYITDFENTFRARYGGAACDELKRLADAELTKRYDIIESAVDTFVIDFATPKP